MVNHPGGCLESLLTKEQQVLLTIKPFLQPPTSNFLENEYKKMELKENEKNVKKQRGTLSSDYKFLVLKILL